MIWKKKWPLAASMAVILGMSMSANLILSSVSSAADFFLTPYRAWEFLAGSLLAWWHFAKKEGGVDSREWVPLLGGILLAVGFLCYKKGDAYPGWRALLPVVGTLLLMGSGGNAWLNRKVLAHPAIVWIGLISYPLYLFHWPALSFVHILKGDKPADIWLAVALVITFVLTVATYYLVEKPIRHNRSRWVVPSLLVAFLVTGGLGFEVWRGVVTTTFDSPKLKRIKDALADINSMEGFRSVPGPKQVCINSIGGDGPQTLFFGDSFIQHYMPRMRHLMQGSLGGSRGAIFVSYGGTPPIPDITREDWPKCSKLIDDYRSVLNKYPNIDRIVIACRWQIYFCEPRMYKISGKNLSDRDGGDLAWQSLEKMLREMPKNVKVGLVLCVPADKKLDARRYLTRSFIGGDVKAGENHTEAEFLRQARCINDRLRKIASDHGATVIDPSELLVTDGICVREEGGAPIRYDEGHLRPGYVKEHVKYLDRMVAP